MAVGDLMAYVSDLPSLAGGLAAATLTAGYQVLAGSAAEVSAQSALPLGLYAVRSTGFVFDFSFTRKQSEVILLFIKREKPEETLLQGQLRVALTAVPPAPPDAGDAEAASAPTAPLVPGPCIYQVGLPAFLISHPTAAELAQYAPPGDAQSPVVLLRLSGAHVLGIRNPEGKAVALYTTSTATQAELLPDGNKRWKAQPFLELAETLRAWLSGELPEKQLELSDLATLFGNRLDLKTMIDCMVDGYREIEKVTAQAPAAPPPLNSVVSSYAAKKYEADIQLLLDENGQFTAPTSDNPVSLILRLVVERQGGSLQARLAIAPPDFLLSGELRSSFMSALSGCSSSSVSSLPDDLKGQDTFSAVINGAAERAIIFRTERSGDSDTNTFVLTSGAGFAERSLILTAQAVVDVKQTPPAVQLSKISVCYDSLREDDQFLDEKTVSYFLRLAGAIHIWLA